MKDCTYLLPIRRTNFSATEARELADYFRTLQGADCNVLVIDGSPAPVFEQHDECWRDVCRREAMLRVGPYDGDVLFDNEEIIRHFASEGVTVNYATNLFVRKRPPTLRKWMEQRPRQAYEDFALRTKTGLFFSIPIVAA